MATRNLEVALRLRALVEGEESVEELRRSLGDLADEIEAAASPTDEFNRGLRDMDQASRQAAGGVKTAGDGLDKFQGILGTLAAAAAIKPILDLNDQLSTLQRSFTVVTGSAEKSAEALDFVRGVADQLGVGVQDLAQSYLKLTAAAKGTALEGAATEQIFSSLAGAMALVGAGTQEVDQALTAIAQIMSKGVVSAEELRGQLGDVLPGAAQQAAKALLVTNAEFQKMLESGEVIASEFLPKFSAQLKAALGDGGRRVETFGAAWARLTNQLTELATGPAGAALTAFLSGLTDGLSVASRGLEFVVSAVGAAGTAIGGLAAGQADAALTDLGASADDAASKLFGIATAAERAAEIQKQLRAETEASVSAITRFQDAVARKDVEALPAYLQTTISELKKTGDAAAATTEAMANFIGAVEKKLNLNGVLELAGALQAVGLEAKGAGADIENSLAAVFAKLNDEQLERLKTQATAALAAAVAGSEEAKRAFADLGLVISAVSTAQLAQSAERFQQTAKAASDYARAAQEVAGAQKSAIQAEINLAKAKGDTLVVQQKTIELAKLDAQTAQAVAAAKQVELAAQIAGIDAEKAKQAAKKTSNEEEEKAKQLTLSSLDLQKQSLNLQQQTIEKQKQIAAATAELTAKTQQLIAAGYSEAEAKKLALLASGQFTEAMKLEAAAREAATDSTEKQIAAETQAVAVEKDRAQQLVSQGEIVSAVLTGWGQRLSELSPAARGAFDGFSQAADLARGGIEALNAALEDNQNAQSRLAVAGEGSVRWMNQTASQALVIEEAFLSQAIAAETLAQQLEEAVTAGNRGAASLGQLIAQAETASRNLTLLDDQRLDRLTGAIDQAKQAMDDFREASEYALLAAQQALLQEQGDQAGVLALQHKEDELRLQNQINQAKAIGDQEALVNLQKALELERQTYELKLKKIETDQQNSSAGGGAPAAGGGSSAGGAGAAGGGSAINVNVYADNAQLLDAAFVDDLARQLRPALQTLERRLA